MAARESGLTALASTLGLFSNLSVELAQGCQGIEVKVAPKDEGPAYGFQGLEAGVKEGGALEDRLVHHPRLDPGIALPFAALNDEVILEHRQAANHRPGIAVGPQPQVHSKDKALGSGLGQEG